MKILNNIIGIVFLILFFMLQINGQKKDGVPKKQIEILSGDYKTAYFIGNKKEVYHKFIIRNSTNSLNQKGNNEKRIEEVTQLKKSILEIIQMSELFQVKIYGSELDTLLILSRKNIQTERYPLTYNYIKNRQLKLLDSSEVAFDKLNLFLIKNYSIKSFVFIDNSICFFFNPYDFLSHIINNQNEFNEFRQIYLYENYINLDTNLNTKLKNRFEEEKKLIINLKNYINQLDLHISENDEINFLSMIDDKKSFCLQLYPKNKVFRQDSIYLKFAGFTNQNRSQSFNMMIYKPQSDLTSLFEESTYFDIYQKLLDQKVSYLRKKYQFNGELISSEFKMKNFIEEQLTTNIFKIEDIPLLPKIKGYSGKYNLGALYNFDEFKKIFNKIKNCLNSQEYEFSLWKTSQKKMGLAIVTRPVRYDEENLQSLQGKERYSVNFIKKKPKSIFDAVFNKSSKPQVNCHRSFIIVFSPEQLSKSDTQEKLDLNTAVNLSDNSNSTIPNFENLKKEKQNYQCTIYLYNFIRKEFQKDINEVFLEENSSTRFHIEKARLLPCITENP